METLNNARITVETIVNAPIEKVWQYWNEPKHITNWCHATDEWHAPYAENNLMVGGSFKTTMAAKDGSMSFDFGGTYTNVETNKSLAYTMDDARTVVIEFTPTEQGVNIKEVFDAEGTHSAELQQQGWQAILDNFKKYTETH